MNLRRDIIFGECHACSNRGVGVDNGFDIVFQRYSMMSSIYAEIKMIAESNNHVNLKNLVLC